MTAWEISSTQVDAITKCILLSTDHAHKNATVSHWALYMRSDAMHIVQVRSIAKTLFVIQLSFHAEGVDLKKESATKSAMILVAKTMSIFLLFFKPEC